MHLAYFDENKYSDDNPYFSVGGILLPDKKVAEFESTLSQIQYNFFETSTLTKETEFHGKELFHGKGQFKRRKLEERLKVFEDLASFIVNNRIPVRMVCIDVKEHRAKYTYLCLSTVLDLY